MICKFTAESVSGSLNQRYNCNLEVYRRRCKIEIKTVIMFSSLIANIVLIILRLCDVNALSVNELDKSAAANDGFRNLYHSDCTRLDFIQKCFIASKQNTAEAVEIKTMDDRNLSKDKSALKKDEKVAYLTFDDGPTAKITPQVLRILKEHDIKATFFVLGEMCSLNPGILKDVQASGHLISNHTYSHDYDKIYSTKEAFVNELVKCEEAIVNVLGTQWNANKIIRFPGGSFGKKLAPFREAVKKKGYISYDWDALNGDAEGVKVPAKRLVENIVKSIEGKDKVIVLMHDSSGKETTIESLPEVIRLLKDKGYVFKTLDQHE
ncbi:polysaccharide deacetylase family protein [Pseudobacteroides cellulosolvens]|uniref:Polysaccharide deacetylase n=1 Tax=Pseudobacteroides cellulosolvens ATCC 35603 = DSM 2933 TaxID=398512 RepID=A0A0L6JV87_9FIRM|nr:polysaccharide deacetylase family protein [Pseudobacteroides cellulosolvens]KNY29342.1 polysaccharide deacetylase [Pseudobacteroides cellulosolvens ATCC 35603 = DSM 2933]